MSICVIGAGIIGLPTAVYIQQKEPRAKVTLMADKFRDITSDAAAGHWRPYDLADPREDLIKGWAKSTFDLIDGLTRDGPEFGAGKASGYELFQEKQETPFWADIVPDFRRPSDKELRSFGWNNYKFQSNGGCVEHRRLNKLKEIDDRFDVVVNCTGLASYHLVDDHSCFPIRGQVFKVRAPSVKHFVIAGDYYVLLNDEVVTLGGTHQTNDWRETIDAENSRAIWEQTTKFVPKLKYCSVLTELAALRPGRPTVRLEAEKYQTAKRDIWAVHNYGHGGSGITLHHGCAMDAAQLACDAVHKITKAKL